MSNPSGSAALETPNQNGNRVQIPGDEIPDDYTQQELAMLARLSLQHTPTVSARSRCDETMDAIKSYILHEHLQPGDVLPTEAQLCDTIGASRSSVREAVRKLEALNIVKVEHGKGTFVGSLSLDPMVETLAFRSMVSVGKNFADLQDVVQLRRFLDLGCADEVVASLANSEQPHLMKLADSMTATAKDGKTFLALDIDFHMGILDSIGNTIVKQMVRSLWLVHMAVLPQLGLPVSSELDRTASAHRRMLDAALAGDIDAYRQAVVDHYEPIESILRQRIEDGNE
ncbi:FadR family transcriptional regulator [Bifidobacterium amazonense]|uniref:Transcriptional regulator, GntR family n=2 Tax=Bifidobacterium TaxID=1678 RepID=A0A086ZN59_9BIFI|nr:MULTISPECIES: FadR/GntR family transcriptional regulator [Bifidobacterium]KFI47959.1 Transcriptional regulator, GntR family [Bifidobacterium biavatii DSM 23969]MCH9275468.1 FadR family transcriptional regulator [Bifidobacterium amazonense]